MPDQLALMMARLIVPSKPTVTIKANTALDVLEFMSGLDEYLSQRADAEFFADSATGHPNEEMRMHTTLHELIDRLNAEIAHDR